MSERSFISLGDMSMIEGNKPIAKLKVSLANDNPLQGHMQFMTLMNKRLLTVEKLLDSADSPRELSEKFSAVVGVDGLFH